jgi:hypothetical protein
LRAGLVPALRRRAKSANGQIRVITPTAHPMKSLASNTKSATLLVVDQNGATAIIILFQ